MANIVFYNSFKKQQMNGSSYVDFDTDAIKVALVTSSYNPSTSTDDFFSDVSGYEVSGTNYLSGGATLANKVVDEAGGIITFDADDVVWAQNPGGFGDARYLILYKSTGTATTSPLIGYLDMVVDRGNVDGPLTIAWSSNGIITLQ